MHHIYTNMYHIFYLYFLEIAYAFERKYVAPALAKYLTRRAFIHTRPLYSLCFVISIFFLGRKCFHSEGQIMTY